MSFDEVFVVLVVVELFVFPLGLVLFLPIDESFGFVVFVAVRFMLVVFF